jgi:hypothetical protein
VFAQGSTNGKPIDASRAAPPPPNSHSQIVARRNMLWLLAVERGLQDPISGRVRPYSIAEVAAIWGTSQTHVRVGITRARRIRQRYLPANVT